MTVCAAQMLLKMMNRPREQTESMPHESDGRTFVAMELVRSAKDPTLITAETRTQRCCRHCGDMFLED